MLTALGLMSGTSLDGVDAALITTDGQDLLQPRESLTLAYPESLRSRLEKEPWRKATHEALTDHHLSAVRLLLERARSREVNVIGFPGQTIAHAPSEGWTWQAGDAHRLASAAGIDVVTDFRSRDVAHGGEGAPLVPPFHRVAFGEQPRPLAVLNLGGVANVTWIGPKDELVAFDTGPANGPLDDLARKVLGTPIDRDGRLAVSGTADTAVVSRLLRDPWFDETPPKSLDRSHFETACASAVGALEPGDAMATLVAFVAGGVAAAVRHLPEPPRFWLVAGGGRHNVALMRELSRALRSEVRPVEETGQNGDTLEAQAFGWLAVRSLRGLPLTFPEVTGVPEPMTGGVLVRARVRQG